MGIGSKIMELLQKVEILLHNLSANVELTKLQKMEGYSETREFPQINIPIPTITDNEQNEFYRQQLRLLQDIRNTLNQKESLTFR